MNRAAINGLKLGASLGAAALSLSVGATGSNVVTEVITEIAKAVSGNFVHQYLSTYDPIELLKQLDSPSELNHDIEKLMLSSVPAAFFLLKQKYQEEFPYQKKLTDKIFDSFIADVNIKAPEIGQYANLFEDKEIWLDEITKYIFLGRDKSDETLQHIHEFVLKHLLDCYNLIFMEGMKSPANEKPLKSFLIKTLEGLQRQGIEMREIQQSISNEIGLLRSDLEASSMTIARDFFESYFQIINHKLDNIFQKLEDLLLSFSEIRNEVKTTNKGVANLSELLHTIIGLINSPAKTHSLSSDPISSEYFIGREETMAFVTSYFQRHNQIVLLHGEGGIGKTTFASIYYLNEKEHYTHAIWITATHGIRPALLGSLPSKLNLTFEDQMSEEERFLEVISKLAGLEKPGLLVLDNANDIQDLKFNLHRLRQTGFNVMITTRVNPFDDWKFIKIEKLKEELAIRLFRHYNRSPVISNFNEVIESESETNTLKSILKVFDYNTLVIILFAKNLALRNSKTIRYDLKAFFNDLQNNGFLNIPRTKEVTTEYILQSGLASATPEAIISAMYDLDPLPAGEMFILRNLSVLPAEQIEYAKLVTILSVEDEELFSDQIDSLYLKGWIDIAADQSSAASIKISPVVQEIVQNKDQKMLLKDCENLMTFLIDRFDLLNSTEVGYFAELARHVVRSFSEMTSDTDVAVSQKIGDLNKELSYHYMSVGNFESAMIYCGAAMQIFERIGSILDYAVCLKRLGKMKYNFGKYKEALSHYDDANRIFLALFMKTPREERARHYLAVSYSDIADVCLALDEFDRARELYQYDNALWNIFSNDDPSSELIKHGLAISFGELGVDCRTNGDIEQALIYFEKSRDFHKEVVQMNSEREHYQISLSGSYERIGMIYNGKKDFENAFINLSEFKNIQQQLNEKNPNNETLKMNLAIAFSHLGTISDAQDKNDIALGFFKSNYQLMNELADVNPGSHEISNNLSISCYKLGKTFEKQGAMEEALSYYNKFISICKQIYDTNPSSRYTFFLAYAYSQPGSLFEIQGKLIEAKECYEQSYALLEPLCRSVPIPEYTNMLGWVERAIQRVSESGAANP